MKKAASFEYQMTENIIYWKDEVISTFLKTGLRLIK
jgi:hypothetical protein